MVFFIVDLIIRVLLMRVNVLLVLLILYNKRLLSHLPLLPLRLFLLLVLGETSRAHQVNMQHKRWLFSVQKYMSSEAT